MRAPHPDADIISSDYYNIVAADIAKLKASMAEVLDINAHPPQISVDGYWQTWDTENEAYKTTTYPSRGETGLQGEKGEKGDTGDIGPTGPQGPQGAQGVQGPKGEDGTSYTVKGMFATLSALQEAHPTGNAGDAWFVGSSESSVIYQWDVDQSAWVNVGSLQGPKGDKGDKGEKGDTGATGAQGPQGPKGDTGATGAIGTSAYDAARDGGYTGTEDAFNTALAGVGDKADKATGLTMTLWADDWSADTLRQTVTASGVGVNDTVIVSPAPGSWAAYNKAAVRCTAQTANALTFLCDTVPTENLMVQVLIFKGVTG